MPDVTLPIEPTPWGSAEDTNRDGRRRITIDPVTRLEGHGKIEIFLDDSGEVDRAYFQVPELRGFEKFVEGRPAEEMPQITSRICGVCPTAHHMAATKALDAVYHVDPPEAAKKIRELIYCTFMVEDHALHFYYLGGPDFVVGPDAPAEQRNILGQSVLFPKRLGQPIQYGELVAHIAQNSYLNGEVIRLDGGIRMPPK